jgi:glycosyltransferase involved in cell wall biosynthesis
MKRARVFVSLSRYEGSPNVVLEAAACGTPLVLSDIAAHRDLVGDETASFVDCDDAEQAAEAIRAAIVRPRIVRPRNERDSIESVAREYLAIYEKVAVGK